MHRTPTATNLHTAWATLFFRAIADAGVKRVVVSPGSRSTPLVLGAAREPRLACDVAVDERTAGFYALGQARATGEPTILVATSGTAGAHYFPAVIEASQSDVPLVVVTADRPWELQDVGAAQTVDQIKLFGGHVRHFAELGLPDEGPASLRAAMRVAAQAVAVARGPRPGPVHVNARFRKPLEPASRGPCEDPEAWEPAVRALLAHRTRAGVGVFRAAERPRGDAVRAVARLCRASRRGLIVCGPAPSSASPEDAREAVAMLAAATGFPVLAEATSQVLWGGGGDVEGGVGALDAALGDPAFRAAHEPDCCIEIGRFPTSAAYAGVVSERLAVGRVVLAGAAWSDPTGTADVVALGDPYAFARALARRLVAKPRRPRFVPPTAEAIRRVWRDDFVRAAAAHVDMCNMHMATSGALTSAAVAAETVRAVPDGGVLVVGNSGPLRDVDQHAAGVRGAGRRGVRVLFQRGANGIDGFVAGAAGAARALALPVVLLVGDVAMLHDLGALAIARRATAPLVVVVVDNGGGRIFERLPIARAAEAANVFTRFFVTPEPVGWRQAAGAFGIEHVRAATGSELRAALAGAATRAGCTLVEAVVDPRHDARARDAWIAAMARATARALAGDEA
jgi:2-succinyl-5-enolpyruvyl-6-hydroxy-3-cyclohexene-1-carboxylate synthase